MVRPAVIQGGKTLGINWRGNRKDKFSSSSTREAIGKISCRILLPSSLSSLINVASRQECSFVSAKCSKSTASQNLLPSVYCFSTVSISSNRCANPLLGHLSATVTSVVRSLFISRKGAQFIYLLSKCEKFQISSLKIVHSLLWWRTPKKFYRRSPTLQARWMSILFKPKSQLQWVCLCALVMYARLFMHMTMSHCSLVYLKFFAQIGRFSWAILGWSRGWYSLQGDGVKTRHPRHLQRSCP